MNGVVALPDQEATIIIGACEARCLADQARHFARKTKVFPAARWIFIARQFCSHCTNNLILVDADRNLLKIKLFRSCMVHFGTLLHVRLGVATHDFPKLAAQVRGAHALLGWSQSYLAEGISVRRVIHC